MKDIRVHFDGSCNEFEFSLIPHEGDPIVFRLHGPDTIVLIRELQRETKAKITRQQISMRPLLRLLKGEDA